MNHLLPTSDFPLVLFENTSCSIKLLDIETDQIKALFKQHGALMFRGFELDINTFSDFTDQFSHDYVSNKSPGRDVLSQDGRVQTVNTGYQHFPLHPEMAREPWQPDIAWFMCDQPARIDGETTVCDGVAAAAAFQAGLHDHLKQSTLAHTLPTNIEWCRDFLNLPNVSVDALLNDKLSQQFEFSLVNGQLHRTYYRPMLHKPMFNDQLAYGNFLVFARRRLMVRHFPCYADGNEVEDEIVNEIETVTNQLSAQVKWQQHDLVMLDNTRFMHGRNPIGDPQNRRIYTQFGYANFAPSNYAGIDSHPWRTKKHVS